MKVTLEFNLPEDTDEHNMTMNAGKYHGIIHDILQYVRTLRKYDGRTEIPIEELADKIHELTAEFEY